MVSSTFVFGGVQYGIGIDFLLATKINHSWEVNIIYIYIQFIYIYRYTIHGSDMGHEK